MYKAKHPGVISTVITIIVLALLVFLTNVDIKNLSYAQSISTAVIKPVQNGFTYLKNKVTGNDAFFTDLKVAYVESLSVTMFLYIVLSMVRLEEICWILL